MKAKRLRNWDFCGVRVSLLDNIKDDNVCRDDRDDRDSNVKVNKD